MINVSNVFLKSNFSLTHFQDQIKINEQSTLFNKNIHKLKKKITILDTHLCYPFLYKNRNNIISPHRNFQNYMADVWDTNLEYTK